MNRNKSISKSAKLSQQSKPVYRSQELLVEKERAVLPSYKWLLILKLKKTLGKKNKGNYLHYLISSTEFA